MAYMGATPESPGYTLAQCQANNCATMGLNTPDGEVLSPHDYAQKYYGVDIGPGLAEGGCGQPASQTPAPPQTITAVPVPAPIPVDVPMPMLLPPTDMPQQSTPLPVLAIGAVGLFLLLRGAKGIL